MQKIYEQQLLRKEADRKTEIEQLKMSNMIAIKEKEEAMQRMTQELEEYKLKQDQMADNQSYKEAESLQLHNQIEK
jgi:hypothetical protein